MPETWCPHSAHAHFLSVCGGEKGKCLLFQLSLQPRCSRNGDHGSATSFLPSLHTSLSPQRVHFTRKSARQGPGRRPGTVPLGNFPCFPCCLVTAIDRSHPKYIYDHCHRVDRPGEYLRLELDEEWPPYTNRMLGAQGGTLLGFMAFLEDVWVCRRKCITRGGL